MTNNIYEKIRANPNYLALLRKRNGFSIVMTIIGAIAYYGFILLVAFDKQFLASKVSAGAVTSIGIPIGVGVIAFTIALTWIYVNRANSEFDREVDAIVSDAEK